VSSLTFARLFYLLSKSNGQEKAKMILFKFKSIVTVLSVDTKIIELALRSEFKDFEHAIQYFCALESNCTALLTRDINDYKQAQIPVFSADSFLNMIQQK